MYLLNLEFSLIHRAERVKDQQQQKKPDKMNFNVSKELGKTSISLEDG